MVIKPSLWQSFAQRQNESMPSFEFVSEGSCVCIEACARDTVRLR